MNHPLDDHPEDRVDLSAEAEGSLEEALEEALEDQEAAGSEAPRPRDGSSTVAELELSLEEVDPEADSGAGDEISVSREVQLSAQVEQLQAEADANRDKWLRAMAEFENFRKRARREMDSTINLARADLLRQLLDVLDNFDRALGAVESTENAPGEDFVKGVQLIQGQLLKVLKENGVSRIAAEGSVFDPNLHEAVSQIETEEVPSQHVAHVVKDGYLLHDMVLRPAMVVVAQ